MTVASLTRGTAGAAGAPPPWLRRGRVALARIGGGLVVLVPIVFLSTFITYSLGALSNSNPAATILGQDAATPAASAAPPRVRLRTVIPRPGRLPSAAAPGQMECR